MEIANFQNLFRGSWGCWENPLRPKNFGPGRTGRPVRPILSAIFGYFSNFERQKNPIKCSVLTTFLHLGGQLGSRESTKGKSADIYWRRKRLSVDLFLSYYSRKIMGRPVQPSSKFLGWKWSYQLTQASLKQFSVVLVLFLILNSQLKIAQKQVHGKSLYSNCVNIRRLIFLLWTLETPIDHPDKKNGHNWTFWVVFWSVKLLK